MMTEKHDDSKIKLEKEEKKLGVIICTFPFI